VFEHVDHPEAGIQIPAGGIRPGESVDQAARREVYEEIGLTLDKPLEVVGVDDSPHPMTSAARHTTFVVTTVDDVVDEWLHQVSGSDGDGGLRFACSFMPVDEAARVLVDGQGQFLLGQ
jgi:8-oxo-dGTP pyrophosphatase MutT (NUDIX family)